MPLRTSLIALLLLLACQGGTEPQTGGGGRVLFIGNSLTYTNDLPRTLADIGALSGDKLSVDDVAEPNFALIDHVNGMSNALSRIAEGWDYVVLQQGPTSTTGVDRDTLMIAVRALDQKIRAAGGKTAIYMVWPPRDRSAFFDNVLVSYHTAAQEVAGVFMPAGEAWREAWKENAQLTLYGPDNFHPAPYGTLLAALVIYECITGKDARELPAALPARALANPVPADIGRLLQRAAHNTNARFNCR